MVPKEQEAESQYHGVGNLAIATKPADPHLGPVRQPSHEGDRRSRRIALRNAVISVGVIDKKSFTRECITKSLQAFDDRLHVVSFATCEDCLRHTGSHDLIIYHARKVVMNWHDNNIETLSLKKLLNIVPVIILSDTSCPDCLIEIFEDGARGFVPTANATLDQVVEIICLVKVGGIFVPLSSLSLRKTKGLAEIAPAVSSDQFTHSELAVLDRLKLGKANKIIAHELRVSESTVKLHIGRIMKKLKVTNRTQVVCRAYAMAVAGTRSTGGG